MPNILKIVSIWSVGKWISKAFHQDYPYPRPQSSVSYEISHQMILTDINSNYFKNGIVTSKNCLIQKTPPNPIWFGNF